MWGLFLVRIHNAQPTTALAASLACGPGAWGVAFSRRSFWFMPFIYISALILAARPGKPVRPVSLLPRILLSRCTFSLVIRRPIPAITPPPPPREGNAAAPYFNAIDCGQFAAAGRHLLRDQGVYGLDHSRGRVVKGLLT